MSEVKPPETVAQEIYALRNEIKEKEKQLDEDKAYLMKVLDEAVEQVFETLVYSNELFGSEDEVRSYVEGRRPECNIVGIVDQEDSWAVTLEKKPRYIKAHLDAGNLNVDRTLSEKQPEIDLDVLKTLDPIMYRGITRTVQVVEVDDEALTNYIEEYPGSVATLQLALKGKLPQAVLRITEKKE